MPPSVPPSPRARTAAPRASTAADTLPGDPIAPIPAGLPPGGPDAMPVPPDPAPQAGDRQGLAIGIMCAVSFIFAVQDILTRHLGAAYSPLFVTMIRYWFFALFVTVLAMRSAGGLGAVRRSRRPVTQAFRGLLLVTEIIIMTVSFVRLGLVATHAVFTAYPLLVVALSGPVLGERIGWRRWAAVAVGFLGILVILQPGLAVFSPWAALPLVAALMFAVYGLLTRMVAREDPPEVSLFWTAIAGAVGITAVGIWTAEPMALADWPWMAGLCVSAVIGHGLLIKAYSMAEASSLQPFAYTQLLWVSLFGVLFLGERVGANVVIGGLIIVAAGLFTWWRSLVAQRRAVR